MPTIITLAELVTPATVTAALTNELAIASQLNLPITSWQPLDPSRTILQINANLVAVESSTVANIAQGGYASYASLMSAGDSPYNDGAGFLTTWMDLAGNEFYNVGRVEPSAASGPVPVSNSQSASYSYTVGQLRFQHPTSGTTYTNTQNGVIFGSGSSVVQIAADAAFVGPVGTASIGQTLILLTPFAGVTVNAQTTALVGSGIETNAHYLARCQAKLGSLSPNGAPSAYTYVAESLPVFGQSLSVPTDLTAYADSPVASIASAAQALLTALGFGTGNVTYTQPTAAFPWGVTAPVTRCSGALVVGGGYVAVYAANAAGGLLGCVQLAISSFVWSVGIAAVGFSSHHGLQVGNWIVIAGALGATGINNTIAGTVAWQVATTPTLSSLTFALATNPGTWTSGGYVEGGDLGMVDAAIQAQVVPQGQTAFTFAATNIAVNIAGTVYLPTKSGIPSATALTAISNALTQYFAQVPVGGVNAESSGIVPWSDILTTVSGANTGTVSVVLTSPALGVDTSLTAGQVPVLGTFAVSVVYV